MNSFSIGLEVYNVIVLLIISNLLTVHSNYECAISTRRKRTEKCEVRFCQVIRKGTKWTQLQALRNAPKMFSIHVIFYVYAHCSLLTIMAITSHLDTFRFSCNKGYRLKPPPIQTCEFVHPKKDLNQTRFSSKLMCKRYADRLMDMDSYVCACVPHLTQSTYVVSWCCSFFRHSQSIFKPNAVSNLLMFSIASMIMLIPPIFGQLNQFLLS